ncbi:hypothetical protein F0L68_16000 [Solihabitans fulvus]|uniref:Uncharacterized protein n=1 Tax=Solihabitans fulvus TaxID=1892852 RepID=A0A5B2XF91_9PSEU|nr:hypothetical protein [Solihabitans fulvus]KAA2261581.1 hypothetical protein F0L68_16000 [Solihabitans fulvus]
MHHRLIWRVAVAVAVAAALTAGCSAPAAVEFGSARPSGPALHLRAGSGEELSGGQWPDACTLLTDQELTAVLPQATDISRKQKKLHLYSVPDFVHPERTKASEDVPAAGCDIGFALPDKYNGPNSSVNFIILGIADPSLVVDLYGKDKKSGSRTSGTSEIGAAWGAEDCYANTIAAASRPTAYCRTGQYYFEVSGESSAGELSAGKDGHDTSGHQTYQDKVLSQIVRTLVAKLA